jgi:DinB superfamily
MAAPLVDQLRFTRTEWIRALRGVGEADGQRRLEPMNSIGWIVGHLAWQEQRYFLTRARHVTLVPLLDEVAANGGPPTTPSLARMREAWRLVTKEADDWLGSLPLDALAEPLPPPGPRRSLGDAVQRVTYHYWFHIGEILAIRQLLGHSRRPEFVGDLELRAPYRG